MISKIIQHLVPNAKFVMNGEPSSEVEYEADVTWLDDQPKPSWTEIESAKPDVEAEIAINTAQELRRSAFIAEADPLYFGWQRGENTEQVWLDKVAEIRARYPYLA